VNRITTYSSISSELASLSDERLSALLENAPPLHSGIGGKSVLLTISGTPVFVKKVPITDLERLAENRLSTANIFDIPAICHYRVGGPGFGVWREVAAHKMTTDWVLSGECPNFPLMYHWRVLSAAHPEPLHSQLENIEEMVRYWENSDSVRNRLVAVQKATAYVALFLEYIPQNLFQWLGEKLAVGGNEAASALRLVDGALDTVNSFLKEKGLTHFDNHFENILTDGEQLYFTDFGLALSTQFQLERSELEFLIRHQSFDQANSAMSLIISLVISNFGRTGWEEQLREYLKGSKGALPPAIDTIIRRDASIALSLREFFRRVNENKSYPYPEDDFKRLLNLRAN
jgi:hypothetical protein